MSFSTTGSVFSKRAPRRQTLNILVCGASGTGKSSFINTLVGKRVLLDSETQASSSTQSSLRFQPTTIDIDEPLSDGSRLTLTLIETEGFGIGLKHESDVEQVAKYIEYRFDEVLAEESRIRRNPRFKDNRIDACLYFIEPTGHGLRELDILTLKRLAGIVNVIPIIGRADTLIPAERAANKRLIMEDLRFHDIEPFDFQYTDDGSSSGAKTINSEGEIVKGNLEDNELYNAIPFAVTSSSEFDEDGTSLFKRLLPFGTVDVMNPHHSDLKMLRGALMDDFLAELKDRTHDVLYETFRTHRLDPQQNHRASLLMPQELADHAARLKQAQIDRETALLREEELRVNAEIEAKRAQLLKRERELRELEQKMAESRPYAQTRTYSTSSSRASSQPTSATSTKFPTDQLPPSGEQGNNARNLPYGTTVTSTATNPYATGVSQESGYVYPEQNSDSRYTDGYVDGPSELDGVDIAEKELRVRQSRSKQELRAHANKLHAELGDLEAQRQDIQRQVATAASSHSLHSMLNTGERPQSTTYPIAEHANEDQLRLSNENLENQAVYTSPLNVKKTATT